MELESTRIYITHNNERARESRENWPLRISLLQKALMLLYHGYLATYTKTVYLLSVVLLFVSMFVGVYTFQITLLQPSSLWPNLTLILTRLIHTRGRSPMMGSIWWSDLRAWYTCIIHVYTKRLTSYIGLKCIEVACGDITVWVS